MSGDNKEKRRVYSLKEGVRIYCNNDEEIRFRKGVWSYNEAILKLHGQEDRLKRFFTLMADELIKNDEVEIDWLAQKEDLSVGELRSYVEILESIRSQGFLYTEGDKEVTRIVSSLLGGTMSGFEDFIYDAKPVLLISDNEYSKEAARLMSKQIKLPMDIMDNDMFEELAKMDLTTKSEAVEYLKSMEGVKNQFTFYSCVVVSLSAPNISLLRNLNRILIQLEKPLILGFLDGPFMTLLSTLAMQTGCFECFEHRMLARLEDTVVYHKFVEFTRSHGKKNNGDSNASIFSPPSHMITAAVISEAFLYATFGMLRLAGRVVNIYLPVLEIQVQDLLRVPYCPGCGFISKSQMNEMYTSSQRVVNEMLAKIELAE